MTMTSIPNTAAPTRRAPWGAISISLFCLISVFLIVFGVLYASVHDMLWFHAAAVPEPMRAAVKPLYFALMKLIGGACVGLGVLGLYATFGPVRRNARFAAEATVIALATPIAMAAFVAETLAKLTGTPTSWRIMGVLLGLLALAYLTHKARRTAA